MSLDTKREEIRKLEEKAQMKEEALTRSEQMLEEDTMRFDAFLKENDAKAHAAIKKAEEETKRKQEKVQEIKRLTQQIQALNSEMTKHSDALADCLKYKAFLDMLTPPEWFEQHRERREKKIQNMKQQQFDAKYKEWDRMRRRLMEQHRKEIELRKEQKKDKNRKAGRGGGPEEEEDDEPETKLVIPPPPRLEDEVVDLPEEEVPMYFKDPQQLMDIYSLLEEQNLFLIQNSQIAERTLEALEHDLKETEIQMNDQTKVLQEQIDDLKRQIEEEDQRIKLLLAKRAAANEAEATNNPADQPKKKDMSGKQAAAAAAAAAANASGPTQVEKEKLLSELNQVVRRVYEMCGFDASSKPETLSMLSQLESKLELLLQDIEKLPLEYVLKSELKRKRNVVNESVKNNKLCKNDNRRSVINERLNDRCKLPRNVWVVKLCIVLAHNEPKKRSKSKTMAVTTPTKSNSCRKWVGERYLFLVLLLAFM